MLSLPSPATLSPARPPVDLDARRRATSEAVRAAAAAPVRYVPAALLEALQGSWGAPQDVLGLSVPVRRLAVAR